MARRELTSFVMFRVALAVLPNIVHVPRPPISSSAFLFYAGVRLYSHEEVGQAYVAYGSSLLARHTTTSYMTKM